MSNVAELPQKEPKTYWMTITPAMATQILEKNNYCNRSLNKRTAASYARDMKDGRWIENGDAIRFSGGRLLDGQHRLHACVISGIPLRTVIVEGLDEAAFATIDAGKLRSMGDVLGVNSVKNATNVASVLRVLHNLTKGKTTNSGVAVTKGELLDLLNSHPELEKFVAEHISKARTQFPVVNSVLAVAYLSYLKYPDDFENFWSSLVSGAGLHEGSPILTLRNKYAAMKADRKMDSKYKKNAAVQHFITAWNAWLKGNSLHFFKNKTSTDMPEIL